MKYFFMPKSKLLVSFYGRVLNIINFKKATRLQIFTSLRKVDVKLFSLQSCMCENGQTKY